MKIGIRGEEQWPHSGVKLPVPYCMGNGNTGPFSCSKAPSRAVENTVEATCEWTVRTWVPGQQLGLRKAKEKLGLDVSLDCKQLVF